MAILLKISKTFLFTTGPIICGKTQLQSDNSHIIGSCPSQALVDVTKRYKFELQKYVPFIINVYRKGAYLLHLKGTLKSNTRVQICTDHIPLSAFFFFSPKGPAGALERNIWPFHSVEMAQSNIRFSWKILYFNCWHWPVFSKGN